jgi:hypothetical protein
MWLLVTLACWNGKIKALEDDVAALEEDIDELQDEASASDDTSAPTDTEIPEDTAPPELAPSVVWTYSMQQTSSGSSSYDVEGAIQIEGDYDASRITFYGTQIDSSDESCFAWSYTTTSFYFSAVVEIWDDGAWECWELGNSGLSGACQRAVQIDTFTCE